MKFCRYAACMLLVLAVAGVGAARAEESPLEKKYDALAREIERLKSGQGAVQAESPPSTSGVPAVPASHGLVGSAAKIYAVPRGISLGGYGEMLYQNFKETKDNGTPSGAVDQVSFERFILYTGYRFNEHFLFNAELEVEDAKVDTSGGEVALEFAYLDWMIRNEINFRIGLVLVPMGLINEMHEPPVYLSARRPDVERKILPSTWRENGLGLYGDIGPVNYRTFLVAGLNGDDFAASGLRDGRQEGRNSKTRNNWGYVLRADYVETPGLLVGASFYYGKSGLHTNTSIYEGHVDYKYRGFDLRALAALSRLSDAERLNTALAKSGSNAIGSKQWGAYVQLGYDLLSGGTGTESSLTPFVKLEKYDTQGEVPAASGFASGSNGASSWTYGVAYRPIQQVSFKLDYQNYALNDTTGIDQFNAAFGFQF